MVLRRIAAGVLSVSVVFGAALPASALTLPGPLSDLQAKLVSLSANVPGRVALAVTEVSGDAVSGVNPDANMPAASTIKIPVMVEVFRQMADGRITLPQKMRLQQSDKDWGFGDLSDARVGSSYTVERLLWLMITNSDNTATNMLMRLVGLSNINHTMHELGLQSTVVADYIRSDGDIRSERTSPHDMVRLLQAMAKEQLIDEWSSRQMIAILSGQRHNSLLPQPLPKGTTVAHKTGTLHDTLNDVGIVYVGDDPYVIAVMTTNLPSLDLGRRFIRGVSKVAYGAFEHFASWRAENAPPTLAPPAATTTVSDGSAQSAPPAVTPDTVMWNSPPPAPSEVTK